MTDIELEPWLGDTTFSDALGRVQAHSLIDTGRLWELWTLAKQVPDGVMVEVGVYRGGSLALLALAGRRVFGFDTFKGCVMAGEHDPVYVGGEHSAPRTVVDHLMAGLGLDDGLVTITEGVFPGSAEGWFKAPVALAHIDVDTYESARVSFECLWPLVVRGGVVVFDDYGFRRCAGVRKYVDGLWPMAGGLFIHNLNGHGLVVKV